MVFSRTPSPHLFWALANRARSPPRYAQSRRRSLASAPRPIRRRTGRGSGDADPNLRTRSLVELTYDGVDGDFSIPIANVGATQDLNVSGATIGGTNAANFSVVTVPGPIAPGTSADLACNFDPMGAAGVFEATIDIASDDPEEMNKEVTVRVTFRDPFVSGPATVDFGTQSSSSASISM